MRVFERVTRIANRIPIALVLLMLSFKGYAQEFYHHANQNFDVTIQTVLTNADSGYVSINIRSKSDVLIPLNNCQPYLDSTTLWFDNASCPPFYINSLVVNKYRYLEKDSVANVKSQILNIKNLNAIKMKFRYIPDNAAFQEVVSDFTSFEQDGKLVYNIRPFYESRLLQRLELFFALREN